MNWKRVNFLLASITLLLFCSATSAGKDPLPSWNEGRAKRAIIEFVEETTDEKSPHFVPKEERIATFDQDGTLWVEHPIYPQMEYTIAHVRKMAQKQPELKNREPFKTFLAGNLEEIKKLSHADAEIIRAATLGGMNLEEYQQDVEQWIRTAKNKRWNRPYTELKYQPMQEVLNYLRANGYKTYIVTGGGQDFVRVYAQTTYGIPPEQIVGTATKTKYGYDKNGKPFLTKEPKLLLHNNHAGKVEGIHLIIGRRPFAAFGNSVGDRQMLEYTHSAEGKRLAMLILHDDPKREFAYGPAEGLPDSFTGRFTQALYDEAKEKNWNIVSMKNDWNRIFAFEQ